MTYRKRVDIAAIFTDTSAFVATACAHVVRIVISVVVVIVVVTVVFVVVVCGRWCPSFPRSRSRRSLLTARLGAATLEPCLELRPLFVFPIASRTRTDADLNGLSSDYDTGVLQREDNLDWTTRQSADARTEAHELEEVRDPLCTGCQ